MKFELQHLLANGEWENASTDGDQFDTREEAAAELKAHLDGMAAEVAAGTLASFDPDEWRIEEVIDEDEWEAARGYFGLDPSFVGYTDEQVWGYIRDYRQQTGPQKIVIYVEGGNIQGMSKTPGLNVEIMVVDADNMEGEGLNKDEISAIADRECEGLEGVMWGTPDLTADLVYEIVLLGYDGSSDATDDQVLWVKSPSKDLLLGLALGIPDFKWQSLSSFSDEHVNTPEDGLDFTLPADNDAFVARLKASVPA
jgi:hypothetical protein